MKVIRLFIGMIIFFIYINLNAQIHIIIPVVIPMTDSITVAWTYSGNEISEMITHYNLYISHNDGEFEYFNATDKDTINFAPATQIKIKLPTIIGKYILGVKAVNINGDMSEMHRTTDEIASFNGWYLLFDFANPSMPFRFEIIR